MGEIVEFKPKSRIEFEKSALRLIAKTSRFMADVPAAIRVAQDLKDETLLQRINSVIVPLSALASTIGHLEEVAPDIIEAVHANEPIVLHVENAGEDHNVSCRATVRENVIHISEFIIKRREWLDRLVKAPVRVLLEYYP